MFASSRCRLFLLVLAVFAVIGRLRDERGHRTLASGLALATTAPEEADEFEGFTSTTAKKAEVEEADDEEEEESEGEKKTEGASAGVGDKERPTGPEAAGKGQTAHTPRGPGRRPRFPPDHDWTYEYMGLALIVAYAIVFMVGRQQNDRIKDAWAAEFRELFEQQFAEVGPAEVAGPDSSYKGQLLYKDSASTYIMYATGRRHIKGFVLTLDLRRRHDLFWLLWDIISPRPDTLTIEAVPSFDEPEPFVLAVTRKRDYRHLHAQWQDLKDYTGVTAFGDLPKSLVVLADVPSVLPEILSPPVVKTLTKHESLFQLLHFTDQNTERVIGFEGTPKAVARFRFSIPSPEHISDLSKFLEMSLYLLDRVAGGVKMSQQAKQKALAARKEVEQRRFRRMREVRQEQLQRKRVEKFERERMMYEKLTQEQKLKRDAKDEKKKAKESQNRTFRVKVSK